MFILNKGVIGLCIAWLDTTTAGKAEHGKLKATLSKVDARHVRDERRQAFFVLAAVQGGIYEAIRAAEYEARGSAAEPDKIAC